MKARRVLCVQVSDTVDVERLVLGKSRATLAVLQVNTQHGAALAGQNVEDSQT